VLRSGGLMFIDICGVGADLHCDRGYDLVASQRLEQFK
jgi:hypothetical protein